MVKTNRTPIINNGKTSRTPATSRTPIINNRLGRFEEGLYGCSEMFVNGFMQLINAGLIRREVFDHTGLQELLNKRKISKNITPQTLPALYEAKMVSSPLSSGDVDFLKEYGIFKPEVTLCDGMLQIDGIDIPADILAPGNLERIGGHCLGAELKRGILMHGGFFLGPRDFYQALRDMTPELRGKIGMSRISFINRIFGHEEIVRLQRRDARFINTTMLVSLLGAAASDSLDSGRVVSGVGGQYNFVAMAHSLPNARSILMSR